MTEQEQAQRLARWLEQPAGTPPPEGVDPEVIEGVYAMRPDLVPALSLTADDILADFDLAMGTPVDVDAAAPAPSPMPQTPVREAPRSWRSANRVAGLAVLLATAATLMLVVLPESERPAAVATEAAMEEVAAAPQQRSAPDPIVSVADEKPAELAATPSADLQQRGSGSTLDLGAGDAVADAELADDDALEFKQEQTYRYGNEEPPPIAEVEEALKDQWAPSEQDAVAMVDEDMADVMAEPDAAPQAAVPSYEEQAEYYGSKGAASKREQRKADRSDAEAPAAAEAAYDAPSSSRSAAVPGDVGDQWRNAADAGTEQAIDAALQRARAERDLGNTDKAVAQLLPHITAPALAGQYVATVAVQYQLAAGDVTGALSTAQRGLGLTGGNNPYRALLLALYGNALDLAGDPAGAEAAWTEAAGLNAVR